MNTLHTVQSICRTVSGTVLLCLFALSPVHAETTNCTAITSLPYTISSQGVYCFTGHLSTSMSSGNAITINTNNVTLDMNGYKLGGLAAGAGTLAKGIYAYQRKNITIKNGTIRGFSIGIELSDVSPYITSRGHLIEDIRADLNTYTGIYVIGQANIIRRNQVVTTGGSTVYNYAYSLHVIGPGASVQDNDIIGATAVSTGDAFGMRLAYADGSVVQGNRFEDISSSNSAQGVFIYGSTGVLVRANSFTNIQYGLTYSSSSGKYMDNLTSNVTTSFGGGTAVGIND